MTFVPCDITRFINIGIHGLDKTRDYLERSLRGVIYQGAPTSTTSPPAPAPTGSIPPEPVL